MKKDNVKIITVGSLLKDLKRFEKKHMNDCVVAWADDEDITLGIVGIGKDSDGDIKIMVEVADDVLEGFWSVSDIISALENKDKQKKVYLKGGGGYLAIVSDGDIFTEADDDDVIGCYATICGEYDEEPPCVFTEKEKRQRARRAIWRERKKSWKGIIEGITYLLSIPLMIYGLYYNIAALVKHTQPVWQSVLWIPILALLLWVCIDNLFFPERNE